MSSHPFITVATITQSFSNVNTQKINTIYMVGTKGSGSITNNSIQEVATLEDFDTIVGPNAVSRPSYKFLRAIDNAVPVYFVAGLSNNASPTLADNLIAGFLTLSKNVRLVPGIVVCPEVAEMTSGITSVFDAAQNLVSNSLLNWQYFHNLTVASDDKTKAIAEAALLNSPQGHSAAFYGYGKDSDGNNIPLAIVAAARTTFLNRSRRGYFSSAAFQETIPFSSVDEKYLPKWYIGVDEYTELNNKNINTIFLDGDGINRKSYTICGARTLSKDVSWRYQNTRYAANNIFNRCQEVLKPFLFLPTDVASTPSKTEVSGFQEVLTNADILLALKVLLDDLAAEGAFSTPPILQDGTQPDQYTIIPTRLLDGNIAITIELYIVQTREKIALTFVKKG